MEHEAQTLLFELFAIFLAAKVIGEIFERFKLPAVLGEILAGAIIGPYALGWIHPGSFTTSIAEIGAIFVLFHAGLETSPGDLIRVGPKALLVAIAGIIVPFALGYGYMRMRGDAATESIFVGAAMVATSVGIPRAFSAISAYFPPPPQKSFSVRPCSTTSWGCSCWPSSKVSPAPARCSG